MRRAPKKLIYVENVLTFLLGCALLAFSIYVCAFDRARARARRHAAVLTRARSAGINYAPWAAFVSMNAVYIGVAAGSSLMVVACIGISAANRKSFTMLLVYAAICVAVLALTSAAAILSMSIAQTLNAASGTSPVPSSVVDTTLRNMYDEILSAYIVCCEGCVPAQACSNTNVPQTANGTVYCPVGDCAAVSVCPSSANANSCFSSSTTVIPPQAPDVTVCMFFTQISGSADGARIVGAVVTGACGAGSPDTFVTDMTNYFAPKLTYAAIGFCVVAGIQLFNLCTLVFLSFHLRRQQQQAGGP